MNRFKWYSTITIFIFLSKEELLDMITLKEKTVDVDIIKAFKILLNYLKLPIFKLVSITTDGIATMIRRINEYITICQN